MIQGLSSFFSIPVLAITAPIFLASDLSTDTRGQREQSTRPKTG